MSLLTPIFRINKYRRYIGLKDALRAYFGLYVSGKQTASISFLKHPFRIRISDPSDTATFNEVLLRKDYEVSIDEPVDTIIDCGANIGLTSIWMANRFPQASIVAIEPESRNVELLKWNAEGYPQIDIIHSAIWSRKAKLRILNPEGVSNGYMVGEAQHGEADAFDAVGIADIMEMKGWKTIDLLKIDVEGAERELFSSNYETWLPRVRVLVVETHDKFMKGSSRAVFKAVSQYDFSCRLRGFNLVFTNEALKKE